MPTSPPANSPTPAVLASSPPAAPGSAVVEVHVGGDDHEHEHRQIPAWQLIANLTVVVLPFVALIGAIVFLWGRGVTWVDVTLLAVMYILTGLGVTVGFHRLFTHRSFETGRIMQGVFAVLGSMAIEGPLLKWVAMHRCHHQHSDDHHDPHSPHAHGSGFWNMVRGLWHAHMGWLFRSEPGRLQRYVKDFETDRYVKLLSALFPLWALLGLLIPGIIAGLITQSWIGGLFGVLWGGLVRVFFVHHVTWSINSVCHIWGSRPFRSHDESRNNAIFGVLAFGEGWHNNHHAFPTSARHGLSWWQVDTSYMVIRGLEMIGLARKVRTPSKKRIAAKKKSPAAD